MTAHIVESDWRKLREFRKTALQRFCARTLEEIARIAGNPGEDAHAAYGTIYGLIHDRDRELAHAFDDPRRSNAILQLAIMHRLGLLTAAEFESFSAETRERVKRMSQLRGHNGKE